jgi:hypothetical protein
VTGARFGEVDLDLLADYAAGVLDGAEADLVADLLQTDPRWAEAHRQLLAADAAVSADLRSAAQTPLAMPADIAARLDAAFEAASVGGTHAADGATVVSLAGARRGPRGTRRATEVRRAGGVRWQRFAAAAAVVAAVLLGLPTLARFMGGAADSATTFATDSGGTAELNEGGKAAAPEAPAMADSAAGPVLTFSGAEYDAATLSDMASVRGVPDVDFDSASGSAKTAPAPTSARNSYATPSAAPMGQSGEQVPSELARLLDPAALRACLTAVNTVRPGQAWLVDFARYEGRPALVVYVLTVAPNLRGARSAVVVGPACGLAGPDWYAEGTLD